MRTCPVCFNKFSTFLPLPFHYFETQNSFKIDYSLDEFETLNIGQYSCPMCGASDRDRLYALFVQHALKWPQGQVLRVLEIAPAVALSNMLGRLPNVAYRSADLYSPLAMDKVDITNMPTYATDSFDLIICSHVLEHVVDDRAAISELVRVLAPGGKAILMVPILTTQIFTDEDPNEKDSTRRIRRFGQDDHVRSYAKSDYLTRLRAGGFKLELLDRDAFVQLASNDDIFRRHGISEGAVLYVGHKDSSDYATELTLSQSKVVMSENTIMKYVVKEALSARESNVTNDNNIKVTIAIPAYKADFLEVALRSAMSQDFHDYEILICDDCPTDLVSKVIAPYLLESNGHLIRYIRNEICLGEELNCGKCIELARGKYIKFLYDDDVLLQGILTKQVAVLDAYPQVSLVTVRRQRIDEIGNPLADIAETINPFDAHVCIHGSDLVSFLADCTLNFIGEPTCVMFRRDQLLPYTNELMSLGGVQMNWIGDLAMYMKLLRLGNLVMIDWTGAYFRISKVQVSQGAREKSDIAAVVQTKLKKMLCELGWLRVGNNESVRVAPLGSTYDFQEVNLSEKMTQLLQAVNNGVAPTRLSTDNIRIFQIYYDDLTKSKIDNDFIPFDNSSNPRPDWREYWAMRSILLNGKFDQDCYIGIFSPKFYEKTHLTGREVIARLKKTNANVVSFSPFFDQICLFLNPFEQGEVNHPGFMDVTRSLLEYLSIPLDPSIQVCDATTAIYSNYFVAKFSFWQRWLLVSEKIFELCEHGNSDLHYKLNDNANYTVEVPLKVFVMERLITLLLLHWNMSAQTAFNIADAPTLTSSTIFDLPSLLIADALKCKYIQTKEISYIDLYLKTLGREQLSHASATQSSRLKLGHPLLGRILSESHKTHIYVTIAAGDNQAQLDKTLGSISQQIRIADAVNISFLGQLAEPRPNCDIDQWTLLLAAGDTIESDCLLLLERAIQRGGTPDTLLIYFDHDEINEQGQFDCPHHKPDFNHDLLLSYPYIGRAVLVRTRWLTDCLGSDAAPQASLPLAYWLALRAVAETGAPAFLHIPAVIAHMATAEPAVFASTTERWQQLAGILASHLATTAPGAQIVEGPGPGTFKVVYPLVQTPLVTIVIPTRDQVALLSRCIVSIFQNTNYPSYEIIVVDNDSQTVEAEEFLVGLNQIESGQVRVLRAPGKFNFSRMNNLAAKEARGDFLLLLNNDTAVSQPDWLSHLVRNALRENVGVVGARLLYPDDTLQHAGVILGLRGPADHPCIGIPADGAGYLYRAQVQQDFSAVTAACLLVRKSLYLELGGLDETSFAVSYNDVDFCLRVRQTGRRVVWTPLATLLHEGSTSQKNNVEGTSENNKLARFASERAAMYARWPEQIANDPAFNPNFSRRKLGYELEVTNPLLRFDKLQGLTAHRVLALPSDADGCGQYRVLQPMRAMLEAGLCTGGASREVFAPNLVLRSGADTLVVQRVDNDFGLEFLESMRPLKGVKKIYEVDDHPSKVRLSNEAHKLLPKDMRGRVAKAIGLCDRLVVSTPPLARALAKYNGDIRVIPNRLPPAMWGTTPPQQKRDQQAPQRKPRIGWAGGIGHAGDLKMVEAVIKEFADQVDWVFIGIVPDTLRKYLREYHPGVPTLKYPELLMRQNWDLAIAPLELHEFNECKSNLKLLEYGWCGIPVVCSDITPYQCGLPVTHVKNRFKDWRNAIAERIADLEACHRDGLVLQQQIAADWTLKDEHLTEWYRAWTD